MQRAFLKHCLFSPIVSYLHLFCSGRVRPSSRLASRRLPVKSLALSPASDLGSGLGLFVSARKHLRTCSLLLLQHSFSISLHLGFPVIFSFPLLLHSFYFYAYLSYFSKAFSSRKNFDAHDATRFCRRVRESLTYRTNLHRNSQNLHDVYSEIPPRVFPLRIFNRTALVSFPR